MLNIITNKKIGKLMASGNVETNYKSKRNMVCDAIAIAGIAFFSTLAGGKLDLESLKVAIVAFGLAFFTQFAVERGIKK